MPKIEFDKDSACLLINFRLNINYFYVWRSTLKEHFGITLPGTLSDTIWRECKNLYRMCYPLYNYNEKNTKMCYRKLLESRESNTSAAAFDSKDGSPKDIDNPD